MPSFNQYLESSFEPRSQEVPFLSTQTASPHDLTWMWWWCKVLPPTALLVLAYCHHLAAASHGPVTCEEIDQALGLPITDHSRSGMSLALLASHQLCFFEPVAPVVTLAPSPSSSEAILWLVSPIPFPTSPKART